MPASTPRLPVHSSALTDRQREVLALIARGKTNFEIATALGVSLETVKYHVTEILTRLEVESREEAAAIYRGDRSVGARLRALVPSFGGHWAAIAGGAGAIVVVALAVLVVLALRGSGDANDAVSPPPGESPTAAGTATAVASTTPVVPQDLAPVLAALTSGDAAKIEPFLQMQTLPCTTAAGIGGPPKCPADAANGMNVTAFPWGVGEFGWYLDPAVPARLLSASTSVVGVYRATYSPYDPSIGRTPSGSAVVIVEPFRQVHVHQGRIVYADNAGFTPMEDVIANVDPADWIIPPANQPSTPAAGTTGIASVDAVLAALVSGDPARIASLVQLQTQPCTTRAGLGGPPKCPAGVAEGTPLVVFPSSSSSLSWIDDRSVVVQNLVSTQKVVGVYRAQAKPYDPAIDNLPSGSYVVIVDPFRLVHIGGGKIIYTSMAGFRPVAEVIAAVDPADWVLRP